MGHNSSDKLISLFINIAPSVFTDHESHGEGLIGFSLANGLAERGHRVFVFSSHAAIKGEQSPNLTVRTEIHTIPMNSLSGWDYMARAEKWLRELQQTERIDMVWRLYGKIPRVPRTGNLPLVVGPVCYQWPATAAVKRALGPPRLGIGLGPLVDPIMERGYQKTLAHAVLLACDTRPLADEMQKRYPQARTMHLPQIITPPIPAPEGRKRTPGDKRIRLILVANLYPNKHPLVFCETVKHLREAMGFEAEGVIIGDGPERGNIEEWRKTSGMENALCLTGKVPNTEVFQRVSEADFLVSAAVGEPYGRGIAEAMAMGTPAVSHRSGGPGDFITHGQDGLLVDELDAKAFAQTIAETAHDASAWDRMSANARQLAQTEWTKNAVLSRLEEALLAIRRDK